MVYRVVVAGILLGAGCAEPKLAPVNETREPVVISVSYPARWLVEQLAPDNAEVHHLAPAGEDPTHWSPSGDVVAQLGTASLVVANGHGYEAWLKTATIPSGALLATAKSVKPIEVGGHTHSHGKGGHHSHGAKDPRTWMDPSSYSAQANAVADALGALYPSEAGAINAKQEGLAAQLADLDARYAAAFSALSTHQFASDRRMYGYLFRRYETPLKVISVGDGTRVKAWADENESAVLIVTAPLSDEVILATGNVQTVILNPLDQPDKDGYDYLRMATSNLAVLEGLSRTD